MLAHLVLLVHLLVIGFNLFGLVAVPFGAWRGWSFVHAPVWRILHLISMAVTALQAVLGEACFLTHWEDALRGENGPVQPLIMEWINSLIYWSIPIWAFGVIYVTLFLYALALLRFVPLRLRSY